MAQNKQQIKFNIISITLLSLNILGLQDGNFESGDITRSWTIEGDGRIVTKLGSSNPTSGSYMAIISTGLGFTTDSGTIFQNFKLSDSANQLVFDWNFYSEEFKEYCDSSFDDTFNVSIVDLDTDVETDIGDSIYDTAILIDNVKVTEE